MSEIKRKNIRFHAEENTFIIATLSNGHEVDGLCVSESAKGCSGVFVTSDTFKVDLNLELKVGPLDPLKSIVRWVQKLDDEVIKVGFEYLE